MEDRVGNVIVGLVVAMFAMGLFLLITAFSRRPPIDAGKARRRISAWRLVLGLVLVFVAGAAVLVLVAGMDLARMSNH